MTHDHASAVAVADPADEPPPDAAPLGLPFRTERGGHYFYDTNTNRVLRLNQEQYAAVLARMAPGKVERTPGGDAAIAELRGQGLLHPAAVHATDTQGHRGCLEAKIDSCLSQLILELTERCNLRCTYCVFGAGYRGQREHGTRDMSAEDLGRALGYFYAHNAEAAAVSVGFYGGEPLLAWPRIQEVVRTLPSFPRGSESHVHMTTNGTLLTEEKFRTLVDHGISLLVSLDGPRSIHDRCRRTAGGRATYDTVMANLAALRRYSPSYFQDHVSFSCVRTPGVRMHDLIEFFSVNPLARGRSVQVSALSPGCPEVAERLRASPPAGASASGPSDDELLQEFLVDILRGRTGGDRRKTMSDVFGKRFITFHRRPIFAGGSAPCGLNGMCTPGWRKMFVAADGSLYACERVRRDWPIGHVSTGIERDRVFAYLARHAEFHRGRCESCWAVRLCGGCQSSLGGPDGIDPERAREFCPSERRDLAELIEIYVRVLERRGAAFDFAEDVTIS